MPMQGMLMEFIAKPESCSAAPPDDEMYDKVEFAITCNENIPDSKIDEYLVASNG